MGAQSSAQRDGKSEEDASASASASAGELSAEVKVLQEGGGVLDSKPLEKNGQISSMSSLNGHSEDNILTEVGQPDGVSVAQKEETPENMDTIPDEVTTQVNGEKVDKESPDANDISAVEAKETDDKSDDASEVGFKKIFTIVGLKFTLKKDKSDEGEPVKLLTVKDKEGEINESDESTKDKEDATTDDNGTTEKMETEIEATTAEEEVTKDADKGETTDTTDGQPEAEAAAATASAAVAAEGSSEAVKEEEAEKESKTPPAPKEPGLSPFRKLFFIGLFSNLRKKTSVKKIKEEEEKQAVVQEDAAKSEETVAEEKEKKDGAEQETNEEKGAAEQEKKEKNAVTEQKTEEKAAAEVETKEENIVTEEKPKQEATDSPVESKSETKEEVLTTPKEEKSDSAPEVTAEAPVPAETTTTDDNKQEDEKAEAAAKEDKASVEVTSEAELVSSQEKGKPHGSPLKKLFTGTGLKKLSTKRQKSKKDSESKPTESSEQGTEQLQSSTESEEPPKAESEPSSPEASGEHVVALEVNQNESSHEAESEVVSDGEKKKDGVIASFKKLVTPKKHPKRSSDSEDEGTSDKPPKSDTLSSSESAPLADKGVEEEETKEEKASEEEPKTENTEKLTSSTEETKKKMDTSVSWEALMCMGGPKKRTRKTSDSDDEETKAEEELPAAATAAEGKQEDKNEAAVTTSSNPESEGIAAAPAPEPSSAPILRESPWATLKRLVIAKSKPKSEEKPEGPADQVQPETEAPKDESSFSLKMFFPVRRKKVVEKQVSIDQGLGEEDSDTPTVVPLSEYDEQVEAAHNAPEQTAAAQNKVDPEDRSPSWIPAAIDDTTDKHDQLSDIPEEAENAATPKSVDTDVAEEEPEDQATQYKGPENTGRRLSTAEVKPITQAPAALTSPVPQGPQSEIAQEVFGSIKAQITEISSQTWVTLKDVPVLVASKKTEDELQTEVAKSETNTILEPHGQCEATAICTGLCTEEIEKVTMEEPAKATAESMIPVSGAMTTEVAVEEKPLASEEAAVTEDPVVKAHIHQVETLELEPVAENLVAEAADVQAASGSYESEIEKVGVVSIESSEVIQPTTPKENSPKAVVVNPIVPTLETALCTQTAEVSEVTVETKEVKIETEQLVATEESMRQTVAEDESFTKVEGAETATPAVVPSDEDAVVTETVVLVAPNVRHPDHPDQQAASEMAVMENLSEPAPADVQPVMQKQETQEKPVVAQANQKTEEMKEEVHPANEIETQSVVIAQVVIQDAVEKVAAKPKTPTNPTADTPAPVQAIATTEKEMETANEQLVITDTPVPVTCEKPLKKSPQPLCVAMEMIETVPIEVTEDINKQRKKEEKPVKRLKQAEVVTESEEIVIEEEITEIKAESDECVEQHEEESKVHQEQEVNKSEAPSEEKKESSAIRQPVQVVLQAADMFEEPPFEVETVEEFDENSSAAAENPSSQNKCSAASEGHPETGSAEAAAPSQGTDAAEKKPSAKCAEVMAQVIEVIEEAVKEIEPLSTEITAAS